MKITEILMTGRRTLSFEVFPPKSDSAFSSVKYATEKIAELSPDFMSVTYGAGGGTSKYTLDIAKNINDSFGVPAVAHLTCVSSTRDTVGQRIGEIVASGVQNVMALRGDIPESMASSDRSAWHYLHAEDLIRELRRSGHDFCIGGACYPETHPESPSQESDIYYLSRKVEAGCDFLTTQMFFDNDVFYRFLSRLRGAGVNVPVIAGIMPITNISQLDRAVKMSNSYLPPSFIEMVDRFSGSADLMYKAGIDYAVGQAMDLYKNGIKNIHIYTMNKPEVAERIKKCLSDAL